MSDGGDVPSSVIALHNEMVDKLGSEIGPESDEFSRLVGLFNDIPVKPTVKSTTKNIRDLIEILMNHETIKYADYSALIVKLEIVHPRMRTLVKSYSEEMAKVLSKAKGQHSSLPQTTSTVQTAGCNRRGQDGASSQVDQGTNEPLQTETGVDCVTLMTNQATRPNAHQITVTGTRLEGGSETRLCDSVGWQFYLDYLASNVSAKISEMSSNLSVEDKYEELKSSFKSNHHEMCFNVLWTWYGMNPDNKKRLKQMDRALNKSGRADLAQKLMDGKVPVPGDYSYSDEITNPDAVVTLDDARTVGKHLTLTFQSLARYFGLDENNIQTICTDDDNNIQEQSYKTMKACIQQRKLMTRRQLCDGLAYLKKYTTVSELNKMW